MREILTDIGKILTEDSIRKISDTFQVPYAATKAVISVETTGEGFYKNTLIPIVRLENHKFHYFTGGKFTVTHPHLSSSGYTNKYNRVGIPEFNRFSEAYSLDEAAAVKSTSWGIGQVMGFNYKACGSTSIPEFLNSMFESEYTQMIAMFTFIKANNLIKALQNRDWNAFALGYNGKAYKANKYDSKLASFYDKYNK